MEKDYFVHDSSLIGDNVVIGKGTRIWQFCNIMHDAEIGDNCNIGMNVFVENGVKIGNHVKIKNNVSLYQGVICEDNVFLGPSCVFTNVINPRSEIEKKNELRNTIIRFGATIGANATIVCGHTIGKYAFVGAGSVVTKDVLPYQLVYGNPAKVHGYCCECGEELFETKGQYQCGHCGKRYLLKDQYLERA